MIINDEIVREVILKYVRRWKCRIFESCLVAKNRPH